MEPSARNRQREQGIRRHRACAPLPDRRREPLLKPYDPRRNAELYIKFIDRAADRIADYIAQTTVRDFEQMHGLPITNVHETFFTLIVGLISLIRSHPNISDRTIKEVMAQTLHIESYVV